MLISIIGYGTVGKSTHNLLEGHEVNIYDPNLGYNDFSGVLKSEVCLVCVPTPTLSEGQSIEAITGNLMRMGDYKGLVIIRSTITPKNMRKVLDTYPHLDIMHNPEFLDSYNPYFKPTRYLIGIKNIHQKNKFKEVFNAKENIRSTSPVSAAMCKFLHNLNGVFQVTYFHIMNEICDMENISFREVLSCTLSMTNHINKTYTAISPDGKKGFGGTCFPDNISAFACDYDIDSFKAIISDNITLRRNGK